MATLTQTAYYSRKIIKYGSIGLVALIILRALFVSFRTYWKAHHPKPPPPPTVAFGKLPKLKFPPRQNLPPIGLKLETVSGTLPNLPTQAKVFFMPQAATTLLAWDNTKTWAKTLGFHREPQAPDKYNFVFASESVPQTTLKVNVLTRNFQLNYDWKNDLSILSQGSPPAENQAISIAKSFFQGAESLPEDLSLGKAEVTYLKYANGELEKAIFFQEANFARVNLYRSDIDGLPVLPPNPKNSNVSILIAPAQDRNRGIMEAHYAHFPVSLEKWATYPIIDSQTAWNQLATGKGFIANLGNNPSGKVTVRNAYLAYYDSPEPQNFLQPIIVFEGDNDFFAYVQAVNEQWRE